MVKRYEWGGGGKSPALRYAEARRPQRYERGGGGKKFSILALRNFWTTPREVGNSHLARMLDSGKFSRQKLKTAKDSIK